ncbi:MAG TPA: hypothetical protein VK702_04660 [Candidatus Acidoferrum sp.]|nr:hypothetical protein [Candidatus Acidoferrum sp.]
MRIRLVWVLFALGVVVAGCGGGGKSGLVPTVTSSGSGGNNSPTSAKTTHASISLYVPPANKQASSRKPYYIAAGTQAFGVVVIPYPSTMPSPIPTTNIQIFPVTTPSPCAVASSGGETCNFTVTAPIGTDLFVVAAFATSAPNGNTTPLSAFVSGAVTVSANPSPGASPLSFTLNGIVYNVAVTVASPDPGNTPNTQVFTVGVPTSAPLAMSAYDATGNLVMSDPTSPYYSPIVVQASPASDGLTLSLTSSSACGSSASGATATIDCGGDLNSLQVTYDGTPRPDANDHLIDSYTVAASAQPSTSPSPANYALASNIESYPLVTGAGYVYSGYLGRQSNGAFWYVSYINGGWVTGTFDPSTATAGAQGSLSGIGSDLQGVAMAPNGNLWVNDDGPLACYTSIAGGTPVVNGLYPWTATEDEIYPFGITIDPSGNLWYVGYDEEYEGPPPSYVGYFNASASCAPNPSSPIAQFSLSGDVEESSTSITPLAGGNGVALVSNSPYDMPNPLFLVTTTGPSTVSGYPNVLSGSYVTGVGVAVDGAGNTYGAFSSYDSGNADIEELTAGGSALTSMRALPASPATPEPVPQPTGLQAFSPNGGAADRMEYVDTNYEALGLVESVPSSPMPILVSLPNSADAFQAAYNIHGGEYVLDMDANENLNIVRVMPTKTWSVPNVSLNSACSSAALLTILERGDSGPFTVNIPGSSGVTATQLPGADHDFWLSASGIVSFTATVTDAHGRSETFNVTSTPNSDTCGAAHRRLTHHRR